MMGTFSIWQWLVLLILVPLFILIFYILSFRNTAKAVNAIGGHAPVDLAWCLLIPLANYIIFFVILVQLRDAVRSVRPELADGSWWLFGLIAGCVAAAGVVLGLLGGIFSAVLQLILLVVWTVFGILHWVKLSELGSVVSRNAAAR